MLKRFSLVLVLTAALLLAFAASAYANFGPHGGYADDTDACAACHRAHTSFSSVGFVDRNGGSHPSALLVGSAQTMTEFCEACHGDLAPGASTNVASGVFDGGPSGAAASNDGGNPANNTVGAAQNGNLNLAHNGFTAAPAGALVAYQTASTFNAPLNGGGFDRMPDPYAWETDGATVSYKATTSAHKMDVSGPLWGAGQAVADYANLTCTDCHDPHGSSNYRLLKADVNGHTVGGYGADGETPNVFVSSNEVGYPANGWLKHAAGGAQMVAYRPNYTDTEGTPIKNITASSPDHSLSQWCAACHENYATTNGNTAANGGSTGQYDYSNYLPDGGSDPQVGPQTFHRHPVDITLSNGWGAGRSLAEQVVSGLKTGGNENWVPLESNPANNTGDFYKDYIGCLTCHRAHGSSSDMSTTGWTSSHLVKSGALGTYMPVIDGIAGVDPDKGNNGGNDLQGTSALLRANDRGVCERCHNK